MIENCQDCAQLTDVDDLCDYHRGYRDSREDFLKDIQRLKEEFEMELQNGCYPDGGAYSCSCDCHRYEGVDHVIPCCYPPRNCDVVPEDNRTPPEG